MSKAEQELWRTYKRLLPNGWLYAPRVWPRR